MEFTGTRDTVSDLDKVNQLALSGDQEALGRLLTSLMPRLYRAALRIMGTPQDAEEVLQDGLLQAVKHLREFEGRAKFSTWLTRIVVNAALMRLRRRRPEVSISIDQKLDPDARSWAERLTDPRPNPEEIYEHEEWLQDLEQKSRSFPATYRSALWLRAVQGMSTKEAAEAAGVSIGNMKSYFHRARIKLIAEMGVERGTHKTPGITRSDAPRAGRRLNLELTEQVAEPAA